MLNYNDLYSFIKTLDFDIIGFAKSIDKEVYYTNARRRELSNTLYPRFTNNYHDNIDVDKIIANPKTIISLGISYHQIITNESRELFGYYSKISYGLDYHKLIYNKLNQIEAYLKKYYPKSSVYLSCDTKIIDDRYFAYLCGNGFYGKNTMLINEEFGSEVFYGTIITDIEFDFESKQPIESKCGTCNLCEKSCPTNSLNNYMLDYKTCLSHLSQTKAMIHPSILNNRIFGCDNCNDCCPYNKRVRQAKHYKCEDNSVELIKIIEMTNIEYDEYFKDKGLTWLNRNIIRKNAILCLGNYLNKYPNKIKELKEKVKSPLLKEAFDYILKMGE